MASRLIILLCCLVPHFPGPLVAGGSPNTSNAKMPVKKDHYGDLLPESAVARLGASRFWHEGIIGAVALSPDGKVAATGGLAARAIYQNHGGAVRRYDSTIRLWDTATGREMQKMASPVGQVQSLCFSPDGKKLAAGGLGIVSVWDLALKREIARIGKTEINNGSFVHVGFVGFLRDGKTLLWGTHPSLPLARNVPPQVWSFHVWDLAASKELQVWKPAVAPKNSRGESCFSGAISQDGTRLAWLLGTVEKDETYPTTGTLEIWDTASGKRARRINVSHTGNSFINSRLAFSADGKTLAHFGSDLDLWDVMAGKKLPSINSARNMGTLLFSPDGQRLLSSHWDHVARVWDVAARKELYRFVPQTYGYGLISPSQQNFIAISADGKTLAVAGPWGTMYLYDLPAGREKPRFEGHQGPVNRLFFSPDGKSLYSESSTTSCQWDVRSWKEQKQIHHFHSPAFKKSSPLALSLAGNAYLTEGPEGLLEIRALGDSPEIRSLGVRRMLGYARWFSADGQFLVLNNVFERGVLLFEARTGKKVGDFHWKVDTGRTTLTPDGNMLAWWSSEMRGITFGDLKTGKLQDRFPALATGPGNDPVILSFSRDGTTMAGVPNGDPRSRGQATNYLRVWQLPAGKEIQRTMIGPGPTGSDRASCLAVSPDGRVLALGILGETDVLLLEVASGQPRGQFAGHRDTVLSLAFSPDGKHLASGSEDNTILIWDLHELGKKQGLPARLTAERLAELWNDLSAPDAQRAFAAIVTMVQAPDRSVPYLKERLQPVAAVPADRIDRLISQLGHDQFAVRDKASRELEAMQEAAAGALAKALKTNLPLEVRKRVEKLATKLDAFNPSPARLRELRALEVLERIGTPEARRILESLALGVPEAGLTRDARESLRRLPRKD